MLRLLILCLIIFSCENSSENVNPKISTDTENFSFKYEHNYVWGQNFKISLNSDNSLIYIDEIYNNKILISDETKRSLKNLLLNQFFFDFENLYSDNKIHSPRATLTFKSPFKEKEILSDYEVMPEGLEKVVSFMTELREKCKEKTDMGFLEKKESFKVLDWIYPNDLPLSEHDYINSELFEFESDKYPVKPDKFRYYKDKGNVFSVKLQSFNPSYHVHISGYGIRKVNLRKLPENVDVASKEKIEINGQSFHDIKSIDDKNIKRLFYYENELSDKSTIYNFVLRRGNNY